MFGVSGYFEMRKWRSGLEVINFFSCATILSTKLLVKTKYRQIKKFLALNLLNIVFILLINFKMPTIVGILTFMSRSISCLVVL